MFVIFLLKKKINSKQNYLDFLFTDSEMRGLSVTYYGSSTKSINTNTVTVLSLIAMFLLKYFV